MPAIRIWLPSVRYFGKRKNTAMGRSQKAISSLAHFCEGRLFMRVSSPVASYASPRQPAREQQQQDDHRDVNDEGSDLRRVIFAGDVEHAEYQRGDQRALNRAGPANRDDEQEVHHVFERERGVEAQHIDPEPAAQPRQARAEGEGQAEHAVDVDAEPRRGLLVVHRRAYLGAETRALDEPSERERDRDDDRDEEEPIRAEIEAENVNLAAQKL